MKNIIFIYAHLDDETILSYGTIKKLSQNNNVNIVILCGNGRNQLNNNRKNSFINIYEDLNVKYEFLNYFDISLTDNIIKKEVSYIFKKYSPNVVFTHSNVDLHFEHRLVSNEVLLECRKNNKNNILELYNSVSPTYNQTYGQLGNFQSNFFVDISKYINEKHNALQNYADELPIDNNDVRSIESIIDWNRQFGRLMNTDYCEAYQQVFKVV